MLIKNLRVISEKGEGKEKQNSRREKTIWNKTWVNKGRRSIHSIHFQLGIWLLAWGDAKKTPSG